ncbi:MAG: replicative DNA helicase [Bacillota bacterium]
MPDRLPPQNLEAEQSVLGSALLEKAAALRAAEVLRPDDFYREAHRLIFIAMVALSERGEPVDIVTVAEELTQSSSLEAAGGAAYLSTLANFVPTAANVEHYAHIVEEKAVLRQLIHIAGVISARCFEASEEAAVVLDQAERDIFRLSQSRVSQPYARMKEVLAAAFLRLEKLYDIRGGLTGLPTGLGDLDNLLSGLQPADLIVLAARPSQGKTALCLSIARHVAVSSKQPVVLFSLEMAKEQLALRLLGCEAGIDSNRLRRADLREDDWQPLAKALGRLADAPIYIDDTPTITTMEMRAKARRLKSEHGLGLVVVDYLQLVQTRSRTENRQQEIAEISRSLKALGRELGVPVLTASQLSRAIEQRTDRRPILSDLRESGAIEQDADVVMFIHQDPKNPDPNQVELIVAKQRNGPTGSLELSFRRDVGRFTGIDRRHTA